MEEVLDAQDLKESTKSRRSNTFRQIVLRCAQHQVLAEEITRSSLGFRTRLTTRNESRKLISDIVGNYDDPELNAPIGALSHSSIADLIEKAERRLEVDLESVRAACISELRACAELRALIAKFEAEASDLTDEDIEIGNRIVFGGETGNPRIQRWEARQAPTRLLGLYRKLISAHKLADVKNCSGYCFWKTSASLKAVVPKHCLHLINDRKASYVLFMPERLLSSEVLAAFVLLLTYTGWNSSSLMMIEAGSILFREGLIEIQGFKEKTDDHTPIVYLDSTHRYAAETIKLLLWHRSQLISLGFIEQTEQKLWFSWTVANGPLKHQFVGWQETLQKLQTVYGLPKFSLEQIRPQKLVQESLRTRDPEAVRRMAGHRSLSTTGRYLDQLLTSRLNQAISLEFQRRLENTVLFRLSKQNPLFYGSTDDRYVDLRLLVPVGDGSSCIDPKAPPLDHYLNGALCSGMNCHRDGGCQNQRIVIDEDRLEELIRKREYYLRNWQRLLGKNPEAFEAYHVPSILFTFGLYDYIAAGKYRHQLLQIDRRVRDEQLRSS